ncbi:MAG: DEAD/DEAH box helicase [Planctomycetes bacterium]|nr:DEAD/DEAH box helicase [Planctomycetota bacterium]
MTSKIPKADSITFAALGLDEGIVAALNQLGYEEPTPIQREAIPPLLLGRDLVGQAATGTGKTAAFALPLVQRLASQPDRVRPSAIVLVPTRELCMQVAEAVHRYGKSAGIVALPVYGGQAYAQQIRGLRRGVDVVIATPGRALDHIRQGTLRLDTILTVVLDEADEMLDMGFMEDIETILGQTPKERQVVLFSATLPARIAAVAKRHLKDAVQIKIARETLAKGAAPKVRQTAYIVTRAQKMAALGRVLDIENPVAALIFCRTRTEVDLLAETLNARGQRAEALHGGLNQVQRDRVLKKLRGGEADLVVATDVAARGLDIERLTHVINYDVPAAAEDYIHRIGRVGRAGREGIAVTLAEPREQRLLRNIEFATKQKIGIAKLPTVADLHARRLELTRVAVREALVGGELERFRVVVEALSNEFDIMDVALAAVKFAHAASGSDKEETEEILSPSLAPEPRPAKGHNARPPAKGRGASGGMVRIFINAGREAGMRPQDFVGAIANEAGLAGNEISVVDIADRFSLVEVPQDRADEVIETLEKTRIRGRRVLARRDRHE